MGRGFAGNRCLPHEIPSALLDFDPQSGGAPYHTDYSRALGESNRWKAAARLTALAASQGDRVLDYLRRVILHTAPLADPKDVTWFLASYARNARARMADAELPALNTVRKALDEALGITFEGMRN